MINVTGVDICRLKIRLMILAAINQTIPQKQNTFDSFIAYRKTGNSGPVSTTDT